MKKFILAAAMIVATLSANAQMDPGTLSIQPRIGNTGAMMSNCGKAAFTGLSSDPGKDAELGSLIGVELEYQLMKKLSLSAGVNYQGAGTAWKDVKANNTKWKDMKVETGYVTVPLTANFYLCKGLAIKSGVQFGFLTDAKRKYTTETKNGETTTTVENSTNIKNDLNKFDLSIPVGISYEFNVPIVIDMRYNIGLKNVGKSDSPFKDSKNGVLSLTVGYKFKL